MCFGGPSVPAPPPPPPPPAPPPKKIDPAVQQARRDDRKRAAARIGSGATNVTGGQGLLKNAPLGRKTLLGS